MSATGPAVFYWQDDSGELTGLFFCFFLCVKNSFSYVVMEISSECGEIHVHAEV